VNLSESIEKYVNQKRVVGYLFEKGAYELGAFSRSVGELPLQKINTRHVLGYLDKRPLSTGTWRLKYQLLHRFFEYWFLHGEMAEMKMPPDKAPVRPSFVPYVFTRSDLRAILKATNLNQKPVRPVHRQTLRTFILLLYGTGAMVGEVLNLKRDDVDLRARMVTMRRGSLDRTRQIPIGPDMCNVLRQYLKWKTVQQLTCDRLLVTKDDRPLGKWIVVKNWQRIRRLAGIKRRDGSSLQPRLHDLKYSFAVHRITSWIQNGADLNRMLPALAAYMGQTGLGATDRYIHLTPERFRKHLDKLSPSPRGKKRWRDDKNLMEFLASL
jgi:integrase/recombinase XerD